MREMTEMKKWLISALIFICIIATTALLVLVASWIGGLILNAAGVEDLPWYRAFVVGALSFVPLFCIVLQIKKIKDEIF